ncbi:MAG: hypothetical protein Pg6A_12480 [Termitinemataceae bacterium]|nr:MAG: hypothetical protein Pg6A_12480 [Termitinemataceae bacterium]
MLFRQKLDTFIRVYDRLGYITSRSDFGDRVTDASGAVFLSVLSRKPQTLDELVTQIAKSFIEVDTNILKADAASFYAMLEEDGFIVSGETEEELNRKDTRFTYKTLLPKTIRRDWTPPVLRANKNTQEYLDEYYMHNPHLTSFQIELTSRCNERCLHCYIPHENKLTDIDDALFYDVLAQCREMNVLDLTLSGGEPLLHPHFCDYMRKAKEYDLSINVLSNLTMLNDEIIAEMKSGLLSSVQVSLYSMDSAVHDTITQMPGSFYKTRDAILRLMENDIPVQISCPVMKQNKDNYSEVIKWAFEHKMRISSDFVMMARYDHSTDNLDNRLGLEDVGTIIKAIIDNDPVYQDSIRNQRPEDYHYDISEEKVCGVCLNLLCMVANGNVYPCSGWQNFVCGNLFEKSLREIWDNAPRVLYLRGLRQKDFPQCLACEDNNFCHRCLVRNANENSDISAVGTLGDPLKINSHFCKVAALNRKIVLDWRARNIQTHA